MYKHGYEDEFYNEQQDIFNEAYGMGKDWVMYNVPLYKIVVNRVKKIIRRKLYHLKRGNNESKT